MISPIAFFQLALANLKTNKLRAVLTMLGMVFGTGAVIATMSSSEGAAQYIKEEMKKLGTNIITVSVDDSSRGLQTQHIDFLKRYSTTLKSASLLTFGENIELRYGAKLVATKTVSAESGYFDEFNLARKSGRIYDTYENRNMALVAILGANIKQSLFGDESAVGKFIHLYKDQSAFLIQVIGVLAEKGGTQADTVDRAIFLPPKTAFKLNRSEENPNSSISVILKNEDLAPLARQEINHLLKSQFTSGIQISDAREAIERSKDLWEKQNLVGLALAVLSLITGGVGIMNIMLLSVAQRSKEIGLRKAVGARNSHILIQFLLEAVILCVIGGILGVIFGVLFGQQVAALMGQWKAHISPLTISMALCFSTLVGVGFGLLPALRASQMDPYEALRT